MSSQNSGKTPLSLGDSVSLAISGIFGVLLVAGVCGAINWLQGLIVPWMVDHLPWLFVIAGVIFLWIGFIVQIWTMILIPVLPISLVLLGLRQTRKIGIYGLKFAISILLAHIWIVSVITTINLAGILWLIIGLLFGGFGVIPIAFVAAIISTDWRTALLILIGSAIGFGFFLLLDSAPDAVTSQK